MVNYSEMDGGKGFLHLHSDMSTVYQITLLTAIGPSSVVFRNLALLFLFRHKTFTIGSFWYKSFKLLFDFTVSVLPTILCFTCLFEHALYVFLFFSFASLALIFYSIYDYVSLGFTPKWDEALSSYVDISHKPVYISYFRADVLICTCFCILAVDTQVFPRVLHKTGTSGYSLMDVGVGMFIFSSAVVAPELKRKPARLLERLWTSMPLFVLGCIRLLMVKVAGYTVTATEYGLHCNFFFTLFAVRFLGTLISSIIPLKSFAGLLGIFLTCSSEYAAQYLDLYNILHYGLYGNMSRDGLFDSNREGIISLSGNLALYLIGFQLGVALRAHRPHLRNYLWVVLQMIVLSCVTLLVERLLHTYIGKASRRAANITYVAWLFHLCSLWMTFLIGMELLIKCGAAAKIPMYYTNDEDSFQTFDPCLWMKINRNALFFFVLSNLLTGVINMQVPVLFLHELPAVVLLISYTFFCDTIVFSLFS